VTRLARSLGVRPGEGPLVALVAAVFAAIEIARGFGETAADSLVISRLGQATLPWLFIGLGSVSLAVAIAFGAALGRFRRASLFIVVLVALAAIIGVEAAALLAGAPVVPILWLTVMATGAIAVTLAWTVAGSVLDARQAKRLFPVCTSAAIAGSFVGTLAAGPAAIAFGTPGVVGLEVAGLIVAAALLARLATRPNAARLRTTPPRRPVVAELRSGFDFVLASPLMRLVTLAYVLFSVLTFSVTSPFFRAMAEVFPPSRSAELTVTLGVLSAAVTATSFVLSLVVAPRLFARFGVATAALILPIVYVVGFGAWIVAFGPVTAVVFRYAQQTAQRGISNAAWSSFFNVVPASRRAQVLAFIDGVPGQFGIVLSGLLLLTVTAVLDPSQIPWLGLVAALICLAVVVAIRRQYAEALLRALRAGLGEQVLQGGPGIASLRADGQGADALIAALDDPQPQVRRMAAELLGQLRVTRAAEALAARAVDTDPGVRAVAVEAVARLDQPLAARLIDQALNDEAGVVRAAAVDAAVDAAPEALRAATPRLTTDDEPLVRAGLAVALSSIGDRSRAEALVTTLLSATAPAERIAGLRALERFEAMLQSYLDGTDAAIEALGDPDTSVRRAAAETIRARPFISDPVIELLEADSPQTHEAVLWALDGHGAQTRDAVLSWARGQVARANGLRQQRWALEDAPVGDATSLDATPVAGGAMAFLIAILARREREILNHLLVGLAVVGAPEAGGLIRRCLRSNDPDVRAQAIEAIDSVGDAELRRAIVSLLDPPGSAAQPGQDWVLRDLATDPDHWIRALALRARAERAAVEWSTIREQARSDPDPTVRESLVSLAEGGGLLVPDAARMLGEIDRMLFLRRVPLFADLAPEDLQRLATTCMERLYDAGEVVFAEGELGDELVVIVEGTVRVVHIEPDGTERLLRRYEAGDHIGEMALLREAPRAATVIAEPPGMRGLVIGGEGLTAILRERPEAAMALLATLATRLSQQ
jgi:HEAT repeat protein/ATP/ADP translocase